MILIYGKWRVGTALKAFCDSLKLPAVILDDADNIQDFSPYDIIIPSPGIAPSHRIYATGKIMGELDFVYQYLPKGFKILSVTGTDGKSTTAWILYNLLRQEYGENRVFLSGNFEIPFSETVRTIREKGLKTGYIVLEISSFMAYNIHSFRSTHSIFTNFETDHLNWHPDLQDYFDAKMRVFRFTSGTSVINAQVFAKVKELGLKLSEDIPNVRVFGESRRIRNLLKNDEICTKTADCSEAYDGTMSEETQSLSAKFAFCRDFCKDRTDGEDIIISGRRKYHMSETQFSGVHNAMNILSSTLVTNALKICSKRTQEYLKHISGLAHRLELVTEKNGVRFVDDSKSTSAQSLIAALGSFEDGKVCLIAGGSDKGDTFEHLGPILAQKVKHAELIGQTREILGKICEGYGVPYHYSDNMDEAVKQSVQAAQPGDTILLSPGCASFGMFCDYLDRAEKFREAVGKV